MSSLLHYTKKFSHLHTAKVKGKTAPHKAVLLSAVIEGIAKGSITENRIYITPELVADFKDLWQKLVHHSRFTSNFSLPFYHLKSEGFWHLHTQFGRELLLTSSHSIKSFGQLKEVIDYASLDEALFALLMDQSSRLVLQQTLLHTYFPGQQTISYDNALVQTIIDQILHEPAAQYQQKASGFDEEEVYVRGGVFKKEIPKIYNYTCCISGLRVLAENIQLIDACHIVPFSQSGDDTIGNGFSLCPNLHRAFDRGLIGIDDDYRVLVKPFFESGQRSTDDGPQTVTENNVYSIRQFEGKELLLPRERDYYPLQENFKKHRERFGFGL